jgi:hypothetical protein
MTCRCDLLWSWMSVELLADEGSTRRHAGEAALTAAWMRVGVSELMSCPGSTSSS